MGILAILGGLVLVAIVFGPQYWVKSVTKRHGVERPDFPGTGGELADHLLSQSQIIDMEVELTNRGSHFDPQAKMVRLEPEHFHGKSVSAVAVAAHEVAHAIQFAEGNRMLMLRQRLVGLAGIADKFAGVFFMLAPLAGLVVRSPGAFFGILLIGILFIAIRIIVHLVTLPVEWDASFNKALPILEEGGYLHEDDLPAARQVLKAAALTYVSAALVTLLDLTRWIRLLR